MARPKGQPKLGGRVKGTPNKATKLDIAKIWDVDATLARLGVDPFEVMALRCSCPEEGLSAARELAQYVLPKKRSIDHTVNATVQTTSLEQAAIEEIRRLVKLRRGEKETT